LWMLMLHPDSATVHFTFQRFNNLQTVRQVGPWSSRGATGVSWAAIGVVGACRCCWTGDKAVIWCQEATGALAFLAVYRQGTEFPLPLYVEERPVRGVVLLAGWEVAQGSFEILASGCAWLTQTFWTTSTARRGCNTVFYKVKTLSQLFQTGCRLMCIKWFETIQEFALLCNCTSSPVVFFLNLNGAGLVLQGKAGIIRAIPAGSGGAGTTGLHGHRAGAWQPRWVALGPHTPNLVNHLYGFKHTPRVVPTKRKHSLNIIINPVTDHLKPQALKY